MGRHGFVKAVGGSRITTCRRLHARETDVPGDSRPMAIWKGPATRLSWFTYRSIPSLRTYRRTRTLETVLARAPIRHKGTSTVTAYHSLSHKMSSAQGKMVVMALGASQRAMGGDTLLRLAENSPLGLTLRSLLQPTGESASLGF